MVPVPQSVAKLQVTTQSLRELPPLAEYRTKSGQATAVVKVQNDTVVVYAICDSLQRMCEYYEMKATSAEEAYNNLQLQVQQENEKKVNPVKIALISFWIGFIACLVLLIIIKLRLR